MTIGNLSMLKPKNLFTVNVKFHNTIAKAIIDSGASNSFVKESVVNKCLLNVDKHDTIDIKGLGYNEFKTMGCVNAYIGIGSNYYSSNFHVAQDSILSPDIKIVLGLSFLKHYKCLVDANARRLDMHNADGSISKYYFNETGDLQRAVVERQPIYAAQTIKLTKNVTKVPIRVLNRIEGDYSYFEGSRIKDRNFSCLDGIIDTKVEDSFIFVTRNKEGYCKGKVKQGEKLGEVNSIIDEDCDEEEIEIWDKDKVSKKVNIDKDVTEAERIEFCEMLVKVQEAFGKDRNRVGQAKVKPYSIELTDSTPIWQKPRRFADPINKEIEDHCQELLRLDIVEDSKSRWSSPIVPVRKKDGELRVCIDYRKVNSVTKTDKFPMPNVEDSIYSARDAKYFSKLDLVKGYYQIPLDEESRDVTAFSTTHNHYQFKKLAFGLKNSGICFQRTMQEILSEFSFSNIIVYIDDILIMTKTFEEHLKLTQRVLNTLKVNGLTINLSKCEFLKGEVEFLGHILSKAGIRKSPKFFDKVKDYPKPKNITEMRQFLGLVNFQGRFIRNLSVITKPLSAVTGGPKKKVIEWTVEMDRAFEVLRIELLKDVMLAYPDYSEGGSPLEISVDASGIGAGACLQQLQNNVYRTIAYASTTFSSAQCRYSTIERELCAIRWGIKTFRPFIFGIKFVLYTDHKPLLYLNNMSQDCGRLTRTFNELAEYDFTIRYKPGKDNIVADNMSRIMSSDDSNDCVTCDDEYLPKGLRVSAEMRGGGNSFFESLIISLESVKDKSQVLPEDQLRLRHKLVNHILENPKIFGKFNKEERKKIASIRHSNQLPSQVIFLAACSLFDVDIWMHHGMSQPVIYRHGNKGKDNKNIVHLQCKAGINFNPVI